MAGERTRRQALLGLGTGTTIALAGCLRGREQQSPENEETATERETETETATGTSSETIPTGSLHVAHMSPDAPNVDIYIDGESDVRNVSFGSVIDYIEVLTTDAAGEREVELRAADSTDTSLFSGSVSVSADTAYTLTAVGEVSEGADEPFEVLVFEDDNITPDSGNARLRLVHASPDTPALDVTLESNGSVVHDDVAYGGSAYASVPAGDHTLQVRSHTANNDGDVAGSFDVSVADGEVYTAFAAGYLTPDDEPVGTDFDLFATQDTEQTSPDEAPDVA